MTGANQVTTLRTMPQLIKTVNALYEKARGADAKAEQLWITLGIELKEAKARNKELGDLPWAEFAKQHFNFGQSRADELIRIADGRTSVDEVRDGNTRRSIERREKKQALRNADAKREARDEKENKKSTDALVKHWTDNGELTDQQIADYWERGIMPPFRLFTTCGLAFDGGPDREDSCQAQQVDGWVAEPIAETSVDDDAGPNGEIDQPRDRAYDLLEKYKLKKDLTQDEMGAQSYIRDAIFAAMSCEEYSDCVVVTDDVLEAVAMARDAWSNLHAELLARRAMPAATELRSSVAQH